MNQLLEKFQINKEKILQQSVGLFCGNLSSTSHQRKISTLPIVKIGCELEFFLFEKASKNGPQTQIPSASLIDSFIAELSKEMITEKERGISQIEVKTNFTSNLKSLCLEIDQKKILINDVAHKLDLTPIFAAKPLNDDCGSALQFNISLHDDFDQNLFAIDENLLSDIASQLLDFTNFMMVFLAPHQQDYARFSLQENQKLFQAGKFPSPVNLSFGADNRTCAIRIPKTTKEKPNKRLEYRVASANADPWLCVAAILVAIFYKIEEMNDVREFSVKDLQKPRLQQIFGNAFDEKYQCKEFCKGLDEAIKIFNSEENLIRKKFEEFL